MPIGTINNKAELKREIRNLLGNEFGVVPMHRVVGSVPASKGAVPTGGLVPFAGSTAPNGYLLCDGAAVSRSAYSALFDVIGTTYGVGDGSTTFNLPDLRGRVPAGVDDGAGRLSADNALGDASGAEEHTLLESEMPAHTHGPGTLTMDMSLTANAATGGAAGRFHGGSANPQDLDSGESGSTGGDGAHNNMPPYQVVSYLVKT